jgi:2-polyprenyl-3-methyl-5-hydroxy-6-metoxy-1,4-benzoquinol methylase
MPEPSSSGGTKTLRVTCTLCGNDGVSRVQDHPDFAGVAIYRCHGCDYWFAHPAPSEATLKKYYETTYAQRRTWSGSLEYLTVMERRAAAQREFIGAELASVRRALDVGCGVGALVAELQRTGVDAVGYDSDETVIGIGRSRWGANIHSGHLAGTDATPRFDLLCLSHVVEHFAHPPSDLRSVALNVRPGGWLFVEVPHCVPWMFEQRVATESHLAFFTPRSLGALAAAAGLEIVRLRNCGPPIVEQYLTQRARAGEAAPSIWQRALQSAGHRVRRMAGQIAPRAWPVRTAYDGYFDLYHGTGDERGMWLRALMRIPGG